MVGKIAAVGDPAPDVCGRDGGEGGPGGGAEGVLGARLGASEELLDFGEGLLERIEVGRVGRQVPEVSPTRFDRGTRAVAVVSGEIVGDDDLAWAQGRREDMLDVALEASGGHGAIEPHQRTKSVERQGGEHGLVLAPVLLGHRMRPLATRRPGPTRSESLVAAGLIQPDPGCRVDAGGEFGPGASLRLIAFARRQCLVFRVQPSRVSARLIVAVLTSTPDCSAHQAHCSANVASACVPKRSGSAATTAFIFTASGPGTGFGATPPVSRFNRSHRSIVGIDTANRAATSSRGVPIKTARTTRSRKSSEYGFMH